MHIVEVFEDGTEEQLEQGMELDAAALEADAEKPMAEAPTAPVAEPSPSKQPIVKLLQCKPVPPVPRPTPNLMLWVDGCLAPALTRPLFIDLSAARQEAGGSGAAGSSSSADANGDAEMLATGAAPSPLTGGDGASMTDGASSSMHAGAPSPAIPRRGGGGGTGVPVAVSAAAAAAVRSAAEDLKRSRLDASMEDLHGGDAADGSSTASMPSPAAAAAAAAASHHHTAQPPTLGRLCESPENIDHPLGPRASNTSTHSITREIGEDGLSPGGQQTLSGLRDPPRPSSTGPEQSSSSTMGGGRSSSALELSPPILTGKSPCTKRNRPASACAGYSSRYDLPTQTGLGLGVLGRAGSESSMMGEMSMSSSSFGGGGVTMGGSNGNSMHGGGSVSSLAENMCDWQLESPSKRPALTSPASHDRNILSPPILSATSANGATTRPQALPAGQRPTPPVRNQHPPARPPTAAGILHPPISAHVASPSAMRGGLSGGGGGGGGGPHGLGISAAVDRLGTPLNTPAGWSSTSMSDHPRSLQLPQPQSQSQQHGSPSAPPSTPCGGPPPTHVATTRSQAAATPSGVFCSLGGAGAGGGGSTSSTLPSVREEEPPAPPPSPVGSRPTAREVFGSAKRKERDDYDDLPSLLRVESELSALTVEPRPSKLLRSSLVRCDT